MKKTHYLMLEIAAVAVGAACFCLTGGGSTSATNIGATNDINVKSSVELAAHSCDSREMTKEEREGLLKFREAVWRDYFAGSRAALEKALPANFIGIGWGDGERFGDRPKIVAGSEGFARSGGKLTRLEFPETKIQAYGNVAVIYTTYDLDLESADGKRSTHKGHGTEIFVKERGAWTHPGWHLDNY
jgi:hypothetical protein